MTGALYLIGLGLNSKGISIEGKEMLKHCKKVYLENYTVDFPYSKEDIEDVLDCALILANRETVENLSLLDEAEQEQIALLVYGSPLVATTHITLLEEAKKKRIPTKVIHAGSIFDAITETGLQLYKFGKVASMPQWKQSYTPTSFMEIIQQNQSTGAHSLLLIDIGLPFKKAIQQLKQAAKEKEILLERIIICSSLGTENQEIIYDSIEDIERQKISSPYTIIIPGKLHFIEREMLETHRHV